MTKPEETSLSKAARRALADHHRQTQAHISLLHFLRLRAPFPLTDSYAGAPDLLLHLANTLAATQPALVVECGSGVSTLVMARTAQLQSRRTRVVALEHDQHYAQESDKLLEMHDLQAFAEIRYAPLQPVAIAGHETVWYALEQVSDLKEIGLLLVDGPPKAIGPNARYPAVPLLHGRLSDHAIVLLDDAAREDEAEVAKRWQSDELRDFERWDLDLSRGLVQFAHGAEST